jgi:phosphonate transport system ATP-binding protein
VSTAPVVCLRRVGVSFGERRALDEVDLTIAAGERVAVVGPSGAGKTTLLAVLSGLQVPTSGTARAFGADLAALGGRAGRQVRRRIGTVSQGLDLVGPLRVVHNVNAGRLGGWSLWRAAAALVAPGAAPDAEAALARVGLAGRGRERTELLSGGERQRVAIARLLVQRPDLVLADEPVSSLDPEHARVVLDLLLSLGDATVVVSLHDPVLALERFDRVVALRAGRVAFDAPAGEVGPELLAGLYALEPAR